MTEKSNNPTQFIGYFYETIPTNSIYLPESIDNREQQTNNETSVHTYLASNVRSSSSCRAASKAACTLGATAGPS